MIRARFETALVCHPGRHTQNSWFYVLTARSVPTLQTARRVNRLLMLHKLIIVLLESRCAVSHSEVLLLEVLDWHRHLLSVGLLLDLQHLFSFERQVMVAVVLSRIQAERVIGLAVREHLDFAFRLAVGVPD